MEIAEVTCMLQCGEPCNPATDVIGVERWENIRQKTLLWKGLDKFGSVRESIDWAKGPVGHFIHDFCRLTLSDTKKLEQAQKRQKKHNVDECLLQSSSTAEVSFKMKLRLPRGCSQDSWQK